MEAAPQRPATRGRGRAGGAPVVQQPKSSRGRGYWPSGKNAEAAAIWRRMMAVKANWNVSISGTCLVIFKASFSLNELSSRC